MEMKLIQEEKLDGEMRFMAGEQDPVLMVLPRFHRKNMLVSVSLRLINSFVFVFAFCLFFFNFGKLASYSFLYNISCLMCTQFMNLIILIPLVIVSLISGDFVRTSSSRY